MEIDRRDFLRLGGVAAFACASGLGLSVPRRAYAVAGIDDALLGGLVLLVATLGGYAVSRSVANVTLDAMGYGFSDFVSDASNQAAAVTKTLADANNLGVELNRSNAEQAAQSIAAGTGYFAQVMSDAATTGRVALDNFISGAGELPGVLRNLIGGYIESSMDSSGNRLLSDATTNSDVVNVGSSSVNLGNMAGGSYVDDLENILVDIAGSSSAKWAVHSVYSFKSSPSTQYHNIVYSPNNVTMTKSGTSYELRASTGQLNIHSYRIVNGAVTDVNNTTSTAITLNLSSSNVNAYSVFSGSMVSGAALPAVDRAVDAPDVIGPGYDSVPLANDLVIDPNTDEVTSAGSLPLPQAIPDVFGDYVGTLEDLLAGVVPGMLGLPISTAEPVVVGTAEGVQSMPISEAVTTETTLALAPDVPVPTPPPVSPIEPPVDVPEGPWTPAITLPFEQLWPFNMIYSMVELFEELGG